MSSFLGGWFDIEAGRHDEIEGIGKMILFPLEFFSDLLEDAKDDIRELRKSPEARLESLERCYQNEGIKQQDFKTRQSKLQKFVLANKEKVRERMEQFKFRRDYHDAKDLVKDLAYGGLIQIMESETYGKFQSKVNGTQEKEDLMKPKVIQLPERTESFTPHFLREKQQKPEPAVNEKQMEREEIPGFIQKREEQNLKPELEEREPVKKEEPAEERQDPVILPDPPVLESKDKEPSRQDREVSAKAPEKEKNFPEISR